MSKVETFGSPIPGYAKTQLDKRAELVASNSKTKEQLIAINSNAAWVMLRSSVNMISEGETKQLLQDRVNRKSVVGTSELAEKYILTGGTINKDGAPRAGINYDPGSTEGNAAYTNQSLGMRPMPGITGLTVKTKNRFGTILQADVEFVVWTVEDLENIEKLFFKPGYTCILEWGHSVYVDNGGNTAKMGASNYTVPSGHVFGNGKGGIEMDNNIIAKKKAGHGNYDGMFGYVQNYNWSFRPDGGYDCSIKLLSRGQILEAMKVGKTTDATKPEGADEDKDKIESKSILHYCLSKLADNDTTVMDGKELLKGKKAAKVANKLKHDFKVFRIKQDIARSQAWFPEKRIDLCYISMRAFLDIINATSVLIDLKTKNKLVEFNLDYGQKYVTFPNHWSIDPFWVQMPKVPSKDTKYCITQDDLTSKMQQEAAGPHADDILNLYLSCNFLIGTVDKIIGEAGTNEGAGIYDVVTEVLKQTQKYLGNINQLDLYSDPEFPDRFAVVDRNNLSPAGVPVLNLTGLKSTTKSINISSKISSKISNMVAIAAQGNSGNYNENIQTLLQWNQGALDRHIISKDTSDAEDDAEALERIEKYLDDLDDVFDHFNGTGVFTNLVYDGEKFAQMENQNISYIQKGYKEHVISNGEIPKGVIPVELSVKMLGISGLKPGLSFKINKGILPAKYEGYGFIITGISHTIESNTWYTDLKTTFFPINPSPKVAIKTSGARAASSSSSSGGGVVAPQEAGPIEGHTQANRLREAIAAAGYIEKGQELSNGGDITKELADIGISFVKTMKREVPQVQLRFTGGNDAYHQKLSYNSRHKTGRGLDFVFNPYSSENKKQVLAVLQGFAAGNKPNFRFIDEYARATKAATAKHFHISAGGGDGKNDLKTAYKLADAGKIKTYKV